MSVCFSIDYPSEDKNCDDDNKSVMVMMSEEKSKDSFLLLEVGPFKAVERMPDDQCSRLSSRDIFFGLLRLPVLVRPGTSSVHVTFSDLDLDFHLGMLPQQGAGKE